MEEIISHEDNIFDQLFLAGPSRLQGGACFSKLFLDENKPIIFQTPKSSTKNGLITSKKKTYCDLLFTAENEKFIQWIEKFEKAIQFLIYEKRDLWFHNEMELEDIEYFFNPSLRLYNKNKYLLRCHIHQPKHIKKKHNLQIYDENEKILTVGDVGKDKKLISILEVLGIKFTSQSFYIDYCLRQIMIIDEKPLFNKCLIKKPQRKIQEVQEQEVEETPQETPENVTSQDVSSQDVTSQDVSSQDVTSQDVSSQDVTSQDVTSQGVTSQNVSSQDVTSQEVTLQELTLDGPEELIPQEIGEKKENIKQNIKEILTDDETPLENSSKILDKFKDVLKKEDHLDNSLKEIDILEMSKEDPITLKNPSDVYLKIYKEARIKAKEARKIAIEAFLEAKRIKNTYLIEDIESDESDDNDMVSDEY